MILVTGVSGALGGLIRTGLSQHEDLEVVAGTRQGDGNAVRRVDFDVPGTLAESFRGVDVLVFVSAGYAEDDVVLARHGAVADAAEAAGVRHVVYTSLAGTAGLVTVALPHRWTERRLAAAPFDVTILRNGFYAEVPVGLASAAAASVARTGVFSASFGTGKVSVVAREDLADAAVRVAAEIQRDLAAGHGSRHAGRTYELEGVTAIGGHDIAGVLADSLGREVRYEHIGLDRARAGLAGGALEPYQVTHTLSLFSNIIGGFLEARDTDLTALLPAEPRPVRRLILDALAAGGYRSRSVTADR